MRLLKIKKADVIKLKSAFFAIYRDRLFYSGVTAGFMLSFEIAKLSTTGAVSIGFIGGVYRLIFC